MIAIALQQKLNNQDKISRLPKKKNKKKHLFFLHISGFPKIKKKREQKRFPLKDEAKTK